MKTERRHELQTNILAVTLARWVEIAKPYSKAALAVVVAVVVLLFSWGFISAQNSRRATEGWNEYFTAMSGQNARDSLTDVAERFAGTSVGEAARLTLADLELDDGTNRLLTDRSRGRKTLQEASELYQAILLESRHPMNLQCATYGLARAHEALGALEKAREEYRSIGKQWPDSPFAAVSDKRAQDLEQSSTKSFYDWFAGYEPPQAPASGPGRPGVRPDFLKDPSEGGLKLPSVLNDKSAAPAGDAPPETSAGTPDEPAADGDKPIEAPASDSNPATEPPADASPPAAEPDGEKPAASDKPVDAPAPK